MFCFVLFCCVVYCGLLGESTRCSLSIYKVKSKKIELLKTFENRSCNSLFWSPTGGHLLLAGLGPINGSLEWFDIDNLESLTTNEHFMCNEIEWDPSGRYIFTSVTQPIGDSNWRATVTDRKQKKIKKKKISSTLFGY